MKKLPSPHKSMLREVMILMKLILVSPSINANIERRCSGLKRLKTAFRSAISDLRLNKLMPQHISKDPLTNTVHVANEFFEHWEYRKFVFGDAINV